MSNIDMNELELGAAEIKEVSGGHAGQICREYYRCLVCGNEVTFKAKANASHGTDIIYCCDRKMTFIGSKVIN